MPHICRRAAGLPLMDSLRAATALAHDLTLATRNIANFKAADVPLFNPNSAIEHQRCKNKPAQGNALGKRERTTKP